STMDRSRFEEVLERLPSDQRNRLTKQVRDVREGWENLIWNRIHILLKNEYLTNLPSYLIYEMAKDMELVHLMPDQDFDLVGEDGQAKLALAKSGELILRVNKKELGTLAVNEFVGILPFLVLEKDTIRLFSTGNLSMLTTSQRRVDEMMFDHEELALSLYRWTREQESRWENLTKEMVS
ncbi:MAG: hypothetical protein KAT15_19115, partial [Bacteroidales bacterium]|nr:hypothetical protein [Bacteroidales bacterium]